MHLPNILLRKLHPVLWHLLLIGIIIALPTLVHSQETSSPEKDSNSLAVKDSHREIVESATHLYKEGDKRGAINKLKALAEASDAEVPVLVLLADWYIETGEYEDAALWYQHAISSLKGNTSTFPVNLRWRLGETLVLLKRYKEAILELKLAKQHKNFNPEDAQLYRILSKAYEASERWTEAYQSNLSILATDPADTEAWATISRLQPNLSSSGAENLIETDTSLPPNRDELERVVALGNPLKWSYHMLKDGMRNYIKYSNDLLQAQRPTSARRFRYVAALLALHLGTESLRENRSAECVQAYSLIETAIPINELEVQLQRTIFHNLILAYGNMRQYVHAIMAGERLSNLPASFEERAGDVRQILSLLERVFDSVSWDEDSGQPRDNDFNDFVGDAVPIGTTGDVIPKGAGNSKQRLPPQRPGHNAGKMIPYGMVSPDEDRATIFEEMVGAPEAYNRLLTLRVRQKNFELPVKTLLFQLYHGFEYGTTGPVNEELMNSIQLVLRDENSDVKETTADAFAVAQKALPILKRLIIESQKYAQPKERKQ